MGLYTSQTAAATAVVGYDLMTGQLHQQSPGRRALQGISLTGSAAIGDTLIDVYIDTTKVCSGLPNTRTGAGNRDDMMDLPNLYIPPGAMIHAIVIDAPASNPVFLTLRIQDIA